MWSKLDFRGNHSLFSIGAYDYADTDVDDADGSGDDDDLHPMAVGHFRLPIL